MGVAGTKQGQEHLKFDDEIFEETIDTDMIERQEKDKRQAFCDLCFIEYGIMNVIAFYMCVVCEKYYCKECFKRHNERDKSHMVVRVKSTIWENDGFNDFISVMIVRVKSAIWENDGFNEFFSVMMNESEKERKESLRKTNVRVCDYVNIEHELDKVKKNYLIAALTGYKNKWWVVCDYFNKCIKVFRLGSNVLQRYIRLGSVPRDVTEIIVKNKTTEQDSESSSETSISETDNKPDRKHLLAVTLEYKRLILILDLGKTPAVIHNKIKTEEDCYSIDFYDGNLYTVCKKRSLDSRYSVCIISVEGVTLKTFQTNVPSWLSYLSVLNGNIYMTDTRNHRVLCNNDEGRVLHQIKIDGSWPDCICVDRSEDKVYICSRWPDEVYELKSDLSRYKSVLDQRTRYMWRPRAMCFYSDKLYVGHESHVTVVRLL